MFTEINSQHFVHVRNRNMSKTVGKSMLVLKYESQIFFSCAFGLYQKAKVHILETQQNNISS